jgi:hypothetical protein
MKSLSPFWFLDEPIDTEHKQYVLLDFLQVLQGDLKDRSLRRCVREIFIRIEDLKYFKKTMNLSPERIVPLTNKEKDKLNRFLSRNDLTEILPKVLNVIEDSQEILYKFGKEMLTILQSMENLVEVKELVPPVNQKTDSKNFSLFLIRSTQTDRIDAYLIKESSILQDGESLQGIIMKKVRMETGYKFSSDYEFIIHEVLDKIESVGVTPRVFVAEIDADFDNNEELTKIAKEKVIKLIS